MYLLDLNKHVVKYYFHSKKKEKNHKKRLKNWTFNNFFTLRTVRGSPHFMITLNNQKLLNVGTSWNELKKIHTKKDKHF